MPCNWADDGVNRLLQEEQIRLSPGGIMVIAIFGAQFMAIWAALFALGNSALAFQALESGKRLQFLVAALTTAFLIYMAFIHLQDLPVH